MSKWFKKKYRLIESKKETTTKRCECQLIKVPPTSDGIMSVSLMMCPNILNCYSLFAFGQDVSITYCNFKYPAH